MKWLLLTFLALSQTGIANVSRVLQCHAPVIRAGRQLALRVEFGSLWRSWTPTTSRLTYTAAVSAHSRQGGKPFPKPLQIFKVMVAEREDIASYRELQQRSFSVGFANVDRTTKRFSNHPATHMFIRVGSDVYHWEANTRWEQGSNEPQAWLRKGNASDVLAEYSQGEGEVFELLYVLPPDLLSAMRSFYEDRLNNRAKINGTVVVPSFAWNGFGLLSDDGPILENCIPFSLAFTIPHWQASYPKLDELSQLTQLVTNGEFRGSTTYYRSHLIMASFPNALISWNGDRSTISANEGPHWRYLNTSRAKREFRINEQDIEIRDLNRP